MSWDEWLRSFDPDREPAEARYVQADEFIVVCWRGRNRIMRVTPLKRVRRPRGFRRPPR